jgi:hypothetical protein
MGLVTHHDGTEATTHAIADHHSGAADYMHMATDMGSHDDIGSHGDTGSHGDLASHGDIGFHGDMAPHSPDASDHGFTDTGSIDHGGHGFAAGAEHGVDPADAAQAYEGAHHSPGGEYMTLVQPESGHDAMSHFGAEGPPDMADPMAHAFSGLQEPPSADHLFADAQMIDHGTAGADAHAAMSHVDAPVAPPPEPPPVEQHDAGHVGH